MFRLILIAAFFALCLGTRNTMFYRMETKTVDLTKFLKDSTRTAVIFCDQDGDKELKLPEHWKRIWNDAPMRFCIDHGCDRLFAHKEGLLPPTMATGKLDRLDMQTRKYLEAQQTRLQDTYDETESNLFSTLKTLAKEELDEIDFTVLLGGFSGRFDHLLANLDGLMRATTMLPMPTMALHGHNLIMVVPEGEWTLETDRNMLSGTCGFAPIAQKKTMVTTEGFKYNLNDEELGFGKKISTSNEVEEDHFKMNCDAPMVFTMGLKKEMKLGV